MMMRSLAATFLLMTGAAPAAAACNAMTEITEAFNAGDERRALSIADAADTAACDPTETTLVGRIAALTAFNRIATDVGNGSRLQDHQQELETLAGAFGGPWQIYDALADLARERKDYEAAARYYQLALESGANEVLTPDWMAPDEQYILRLDRLANEMRLAAPRPVQIAASRASGCKLSFRGVKIQKKSMPVRYVFGTADFTPEGIEAAKDLAECLKAMKPSEITLIGHTDPVGSAEANYRLSVARAETLAAYLATAGISSRISTVGKGKDEPFKPDDASAYDTDTLHQMHRRVEVDVKQ